jgi:phosphoenolpyruvate carboxylase
MYIARKYKQSNVVEYVLYMWHIEELMRSFNLDLDAIAAGVIDGFNLNQEARTEMLGWYASLIQQMRRQGITESGHLEELNEIMMELIYLHQSLLTVYQDREYQELLATAHPNLDELKKKSMGKARNEVETAMNGLFGVLVLKLNKRQLSDATQDAIKSISQLMAHLAKQYHRMKEGSLSLPKVMGN